MATTIRLTVLTGPHKARRFCFRGPTRCTVGRAPDCSVRLSGDGRDCTISRHHCELHINACVRLQDLGSLNGTYRNGKKLEPAETDMPEVESLMRKLSVATDLEDGDIITVGETSFKINLVDCPLSSTATSSDAPVWPEGAVAKPDCPAPCG